MVVATFSLSPVLRGEGRGQAHPPRSPNAAQVRGPAPHPALSPEYRGEGSERGLFLPGQHALIPRGKRFRATKLPQPQSLQALCVEFVICKSIWMITLTWRIV